LRSSSPTSTSERARVRAHFRARARSFDRLYDEEHALQRLLRPGLLRRRELAVSVVRSYEAPRVLDVACGSGRVAEFVLDAGASAYVGVDFSEPMLALARERLERFGDKVSLVQGDFLEAPLDGPFDVVLALGLFDYLGEPEPFVRRMHALCSGSLVASFPRWTWVKGPIRKLRYEVLADCPIFDYTERELRFLFGAAGFTTVEIIASGRSGYLLRAGFSRRGTPR
jgi:SAM-dependent methyltransferase